MKNHKVSNHFTGNFNMIYLQLLEHAEQYIMGITVVACTHNNINTIYH